MDKIINIAVVAHVDAGKSTLVDALLKQNGVFKAHEDVGELIMDSDTIEKERGITIYSKNCSIHYKDYKINIVDTPGHADFSSEVERVIKTVDTVVLIVDSAEGPMPQTRFVLKKALEQNLKPILFINKIDKKDARPTEVVDMTFNLFMELNASDEQLDFPIVYGVAKEGKCSLDANHLEDTVEPLLETILKQVKPYEGSEADPLQLQISNLDYDNFLGRLGVGRITKGIIKAGESVALARNDGKIENFKISKLYVTEGIKRVEKNVAYYGDIVTIAGCADISIGDTICSKEHVEPLPPIEIERPTLSMNFLVNNGPFAGKSGKFLTTRHLKERLERELQTNVGLLVEELPNSDGYKVSGRGELHLSILLENMRREGYELCVSKPEVLFEEINGQKCEPFERVIINCPGEYQGTVINDLQERKATLEVVSTTDEGYSHLEFLAPNQNIAKGHNLDIEAEEQRHHIALNLFKDFSTGLYQISIVFNDNVYLSNGIEKIGQPINSIFLLYDCDYRLVINDAEQILLEYKTNRKFRLDKLNYIDIKYALSTFIDLSEQEFEEVINGNRMTVERDGKTYLIIGKNNYLISAHYKEGWNKK